MLRQAFSELCLALEIEPSGPLLVKAGEPEEEGLGRSYTSFQESYLGFLQKVGAKREKKPGERDMQFVRTWRNGRREPYLPGSSLRGVLRSRGERLARTFGSEALSCCDPFLEPEDGKALPPGEIPSCSWRLEEHRKARSDKTLPGYEAYALACPICKVFGCSALAGRLKVSDFYWADKVPPPDPLRYRDSVGIDRATGAAREGAKFDYEVLEWGRFAGTIVLRNFELWQVGLLAYLLDELNQGDLPVGFGRHRGLGHVHGSVHSCTIAYFGPRVWRHDSNVLELVGVGRLSREYGLPDWQKYGFT
ncbi:MAG: hypothetical protein FJ026_08340, partial [Chloroflexi bacterium]|nr:hypothetical protein [Chloroflexota bacterium]